MLLPFTRKHKHDIPATGILSSYMPERILNDVTVPEHIRRNLDKAAGPTAFLPRGSGLGWEEVIYTPNADGTAVTSSSETILLPDFSIPASYLTVGKILKYTIIASAATVVANLGMRMAPTSAPATATIDTTIDKLLSATYQSSVATASCQTHVGILEACN
jgi:hypothetical protein